jgi:hypothetical protein
VTDEFAWWRKALSGAKQMIDADSPQSGFYRKRAHKDGPWQPVMIRLQDGELRCRVGDDSTVDPLTVWTYCADNPVSKEAAAFAFKNKRWETDAPTVGDNSGNASPLELLRDYIETARAWFKGKKLDTQKAVDEAANYANELIRLKGVADKERDALVRPHLTAQREINSKYNPEIENAETLAKTIKRGCDDFMRAEKARLEAEQRAKYMAELKAAEEARKAVEEQRAKQMADDPIAALTSPDVEMPELPMGPKAPEPVKVQAGGQRGKKMALRTYTVHEVTDYAAALEWAKLDAKVIETVTAVCVAAARGGQTVPGVTTRQEERAA